MREQRSPRSVGPQHSPRTPLASRQASGINLDASAAAGAAAKGASRGGSKAPSRSGTPHAGRAHARRAGTLSEEDYQASRIQAHARRRRASRSTERARREAEAAAEGLFGGGALDGTHDDDDADGFGGFLAGAAAGYLGDSRGGSSPPASPQGRREARGTPGRGKERAPRSPSTGSKSPGGGKGAKGGKGGGKGARPFVITDERQLADLEQLATAIGRFYSGERRAPLERPSSIRSTTP